MKNRNARKIAIAHTMDASWGQTQYRLNGIFFNLFVPLWAIDLFALLHRLASAASFYMAIYLRKMGLLRMAIVSHVFQLLTLGLGIICNSILSPFIMSISALSMGGRQSADSALMQREFSDSERATMRSIVNILGGVLIAAAAYLFGMMADVYSIYHAMLGLLAYKFILTLYYWYLMRTWKH